MTTRPEPARSEPVVPGESACTLELKITPTTPRHEVVGIAGLDVAAVRRRPGV